MRTLNSKSAMWLRILWIVLPLLLTGSCATQEKQTTGNLESTCPTYTSSFSPQRIILTLTESPATSQAVTWRTCAKIDDPKAQIALMTNSSVRENLSATVHAASEEVELGKGKPIYHHSAVFENLEPDTLYAYRVGSEHHWSEWNQFRTAGKSGDPFTFIYFGDPQEDVKSMCSRIFRAAFKKAPDADFWLFVGDLVDNGDRDEEWAELFHAFGWIPGMTPMVFLPGNHEYPDKRYLRGKPYRVFPLWRPHFTLPENGPDGLEETAYYLDYQGVRFVMLNGNEKIEEQAGWLDGILSDNPQPWTIVGIHQPVYSSAKYRDDSNLQKYLVPLFDKYAVDLVLQGHDHTYCRTHKVRDGVKTGDRDRGTVYIISVSGPKFYEVKTRHEELMAITDTGRQLFQVIRVDRHRLCYESFDARGEVFDSFTLEKHR